MAKVVVIGGGWAGCAAAVTAKKAGAKVTLLEKTDMLLGCGLAGGIMRNNGRYTACEEAIALGAGDLFEITDKAAKHVNINFPGHKHASLYDVKIIEPMVRKHLENLSIELKFNSRVVDIDIKQSKLKSVMLDNEIKILADVFIETTGSSGPMGNCTKYGNGCAMCMQRCPAFGPRISISKKAGVKDLIGKRSEDIYGAMSGSCEIITESLDKSIRKELLEKGVVVVELPQKFINRGKLDIKVCQQYALQAYAENIILLDTGYAKLMTPFFPVNELRQIKGFENMRFADPCAAGRGNSVRYMSMAPRDDYMKVMSVENLFCAGEKSGPFVGHTEAICTGSLAGHNSVRQIANIDLLKLSTELAIGDLISFVNKEIKSKNGLYRRFTFAGSEYFERMKHLGLYEKDSEKISQKIDRLGLLNIFNKKII